MAHLGKSLSYFGQVGSDRGSNIVLLRLHRDQLVSQMLKHHPFSQEKLDYFQQLQTSEVMVTFVTFEEIVFQKETLVEHLAVGALIELSRLKVCMVVVQCLLGAIHHRYVYVIGRCLRYLEKCLSLLYSAAQVPVAKGMLSIKYVTCRLVHSIIKIPLGC